MSARPATARSTAQRRASRTAHAARARRRQVWRRRFIFLAVVALAAIIVTVVMAPWADKAVKELSLPLRHEDVIRQQANAKKLDPTLIAGVIYVESHFIDQTSHAGAKGLMQLMPSTADYIARKSGGTRFQQGMGADAAIRLCVDLLGGPDSTLGPDSLEVAILDRARARRAFRRIEGPELSTILAG